MELHRHENGFSETESVRENQQLEELANLLASADSEMMARLRMHPQWLNHLKAQRTTLLPVR